jgi:hypothetical protein
MTPFVNKRKTHDQAQRIGTLTRVGKIAAD